VCWLHVPLPWALNHIKLWAIDDGEVWALVDAGTRTDKAATV
jgi:hypothetical protein